VVAWKFLREFARKPASVGALAPSSPFLADHVVRAADIRTGQWVAELGAGTGPITAKIREVAPGARVLAFEPNPDLAATLRLELAGVEVVERLAHELPAVVRERGLVHVDRVVSSLPWSMWPDEEQDPVFDAIASALAPDGRMVTFTYVHAQMLPQAIRLKKALQHRFEAVDRTEVQWKNFPPAFVWVCDRPFHLDGQAAAVS